MSIATTGRMNTSPMEASGSVTEGNHYVRILNKSSIIIIVKAIIRFMIAFAFVLILFFFFLEL